jgi:hypothetical protein
MKDLRIVNVLIIIKRAFIVKCPGLSLAVIDMLKSYSDYLSDLSLVTDY